MLWSVSNEETIAPGIIRVGLKPVMNINQLGCQIVKVELGEGQASQVG